MNKRGTMGLAIIVAVTIFLVGMMSINFIMPEVTTARSSDALDCSNSSISDGNKLTCIAVDFVVPYFIVLIFSISGGFITAKVLR